MSKKRTRRRFSAEFKARIAMEAARGVKTVGTIADENELHPVQVSQWKKELLDSVHLIFEKDNKDARQDAEAAERREAHLERKVGQLTIELEWLQKKSKELGL
jgi:transposase-like protein